MLDESFKTSRAVPGLDDRVVAHLGSLLARSMHGKVASFEKGSLPPLRLRRPEASSTWSSPFSSFGPPSSRRGRRAETPPPLMLKAPQLGSHALMSRRTFSLPRTQEGQCGPGDHDGFDGHCADLVPVATPRSGNGRVRAATSCRPPRPSSTIAIEARDASPDSTSFRCGLPPLPRMDSAQTISRPESQQGRTPSILRTSRSRERSNSQSKRVSFSGDCKPAPPASINDLIHQCKAHPEEVSVPAPGMQAPVPFHQSPARRPSPPTPANRTHPCRSRIRRNTEARLQEGPCSCIPCA
mmetsp:Transcript_59737/g.139839  ORF Transcript_59737/g.139839 Transcript_59737/m.139839 type:complete len:297 (+) Transcript_59737:104-994(+)